jgi:hypothetical protein
MTKARAREREMTREREILLLLLLLLVPFVALVIEADKNIFVMNANQ